MRIDRLLAANLTVRRQLAPVCRSSGPRPRTAQLPGECAGELWDHGLVSMSSDRARDAGFVGSIPEMYERYMVPLIFQSYADDLASRVAQRHPASVLEMAAGTGVVTRAMSCALGDHVAITATDLNQAMIDRAVGVGTSRAVQWQQADAMALPFDDASFDVVVCQFGVMFFPDRRHAYTEVRRVLRPGGVFLFNAWDRLERNEFAHTVSDAVATVFPDDRPQLMARTPHGYHDPSAIRADVLAAGFGDIDVEVREARSHAATSATAAMAYCQGTPLRNEIEARDPDGLPHVTAVAEEALTQRFGATDLDGALSAFVVAAS